MGLCPPAASRAYIAHVLRDSFQGDIELAAQWVLEHDVLAKGEEWQAAEKAAAARREKEQREHAKEKKRLAERWKPCLDEQGVRRMRPSLPVLRG